MKIVWDEPKRLANIEKHGLDFSALDGEFFLGSLVVPAKSGRFKAIGKLADGVVAVVFVRLGMEGVSVVSMRSASRTERRHFDEET
ncbi:BrnT family toxin [Mesorhizobium sp. PUT5]|uniref:BrnT family toxin n=1 Tax=Mesorhizobium sp. PUT5 TaxID=3454629 RepID=UPI003FA48B9E